MTPLSSTSWLGSSDKIAGLIIQNLTQNLTSGIFGVKSFRLASMKIEPGHIAYRSYMKRHTLITDLTTSLAVSTFSHSWHINVKGSQTEKERERERERESGGQTGRHLIAVAT